MSISCSYIPSNKTTEETVVFSNPAMLSRATVHSYYPYLYTLTINTNESFYYYGKFYIVRNRSTNKLNLFTSYSISYSSGAYSNSLHLIPIIGDLPAFVTSTNSNGGPKYIEDKNRIDTAIFDKINGDRISTIDYDIVLETIVQNWFSIYYDPVYKNNTKINYSDGTYEVIDDVLTEEQAKQRAYNSLLQTYGTFYKATETEVVSYYQKEEVNI